jgi:hypothetical protein
MTIVSIGGLRAFSLSTELPLQSALTGIYEDLGLKLRRLFYKWRAKTRGESACPAIAAHPWQKAPAARPPALPGDSAVAHECVRHIVVTELP